MIFTARLTEKIIPYIHSSIMLAIREFESLVSWSRIHVIYLLTTLNLTLQYDFYHIDKEYMYFTA